MGNETKQIKKTVHLNTRLRRDKEVINFFEAAADGRSFSSFVKDVMYEQSLLFKKCGNPVGITPAIQNHSEQIHAPEIDTSMVNSSEEDISEADTALSTNSAVNDAVDSMFPGQ